MALAQPSGLHADRLVGLMNRHPEGGDRRPGGRQLGGLTSGRTQQLGQG